MSVWAGLKTHSPNWVNLQFGQTSVFRKCCRSKYLENGLRWWCRINEIKHSLFWIGEANESGHKNYQYVGLFICCLRAFALMWDSQETCNGSILLHNADSIALCVWVPRLCMWWDAWQTAREGQKQSGANQRSQICMFAFYVSITSERAPLVL